MVLNNEKTLASVQISADMTAAELDTLLRKLALLRAEMSPPIPSSRDALQEADVLVEDKPGLIIAARKNGGYRLWLRHRGYGWLAYQIDEPNAASMADFIRARTQQPRIDLIGHQEPHRH